MQAYEDFSSMRASDLKMRIEEMLRIKVNVNITMNSIFWPDGTLVKEFLPSSNANSLQKTRNS